MTFLEWLREHLMASLKPDISIDVDDNLYDWLEEEQAALRARLQADRDLIARREGRLAGDRPEDAR